MSHEAPANDRIEYAYHFRFPDGGRRSFVVSLDAATLAFRGDRPDSPPDWTGLGFHRCPGCPLDPARNPGCPRRMAPRRPVMI